MSPAGALVVCGCRGTGWLAGREERGYQKNRGCGLYSPIYNIPHAFERTEKFLLTSTQKHGKRFRAN